MTGRRKKSLIAISSLLLLSSSISAQSTQQSVPPQSQSQGYASISRQNENIVLRHIRPVLRASGYAGLITYNGSCHTNNPDFVEFPRVNMSRPGEGTTLGVIREMFENDSAVKVKEKPGKVIEIKIGSPVTSFLRTKISVLRLGPIDQYNPDIAIYAIMGANEVRTKMKRLNFYTQQIIIFDTLIAEPAPGLPHLPAVLKNVSVEQILKLIAKKFGWIAVYGTCRQPNGKGFVKVNFVGFGY